VPIGLRAILLTGDGRAVADAIGAAVGVDEVLAEVLPTDKARAIEALQADGRRVAMVGDGINDTAARANANLGMAVVTIILVRDSLDSVPGAVVLAWRKLRIIRGNLVCEFACNVALHRRRWVSGLLNRSSRARRCRCPASSW
jgi:P-type Cu+ transporter